MSVLYVDNSNVVELTDVKNSVTGDPDTGASVSVTLLDSADNEVAGQAWPLPMAHDADGTYRATMSANIDVANGEPYYAVVDAIGSNGSVGKWRCKVKASERKCS